MVGSTSNIVRRPKSASHYHQKYTVKTVKHPPNVIARSNISVDEHELACRKKFAVDNILYERLIAYQVTGKHVAGLTVSERKTVWRVSSSFQWDAKEKILYYKRQKQSKRRKVVRSVDELASVLKMYHSSPSGGHCGWNATYEKISKVYYWRSMVHDIKHYISTCSECQGYTPIKNHVPTVKPIKVMEPWELIGGDMIDMWPKDAEAFLIERIRATRLLWDIRHPDYTKEILKTCLYDQIATEMQTQFQDLNKITGENVQAKFNDLQSSFQRELSNMRANKSGSGGDYTLKWKPFESLLFLTDVVTLQESSSNFNASVVQESQLLNDTLCSEVQTETEDDTIYQVSSDESPTQGIIPQNRDSPTSTTAQILPPVGEDRLTSPVTDHSSMLKRKAIPGPMSNNSKMKKDSPADNMKWQDVLLFLQTVADDLEKENIPYFAGAIVRQIMKNVPASKQLTVLYQLVGDLLDYQRRGLLAEEEEHS